MVAGKGPRVFFRSAVTMLAVLLIASACSGQSSQETTTTAAPASGQTQPESKGEPGTKLPQGTSFDVTAGWEMVEDPGLVARYEQAMLDVTVHGGALVAVGVEIVKDVISEVVAAEETLAMAGWEVTLLEFIPDGTEFALAASEYTDPPEEGMVYTLAQFELTNTHAEQRRYQDDILIVRAAPVASDLPDYPDYCGLLPGDRLSQEIAPGATVTGYLCWELPAGEGETMATEVIVARI